MAFVRSRKQFEKARSLITARRSITTCKHSNATSPMSNATSEVSSRPAMDGGSPIRKNFLPFCTPFIGPEEKAEVIAALESGWLSTGPRVKRFEEEAADYLGAKHAIGISSCTAGLHVALVAAGIGAGDEVITSPLTFVATANVILHTGAKPVFSDVESDTYNISVEQIARIITA